MNTCAILTPYVVTAEGIIRPAVAHEYALTDWLDITNLPNSEMIPAPNLLLIRVQVDPGTLAAIEANPAYQVIWSE